MKRVNCGEKYYVITNLTNIAKVCEENDEFDDNHFTSGNYFNTKEEAVEELKRIEKIIEKYK